MTVYIALCDDESIDLQREEAQIRRALPASEKWEIDTFTDSDALLASDKIYQLVFLDVEMDGTDGIAAAEQIHQKNPHCFIFFVTHHEGYMDEALNKHAFRFWTKPISQTRLVYGIQSALKELRLYHKSLTVTVSKTPVRVPLKDILYVYHSGRMTCLVTTEGEIKTYDTYQSVLTQLDTDDFAETHASCCVNMNYVVRYNKTEVLCEYEGRRYSAFLSKRKLPIFAKKFIQWSGGIQ